MRQVSLIAQLVKNLRRPGFDFRVWKIPWRKEMTTHSNILAWKMPWTEEATVHGVARVGHDLATKEREREL